MAPMVYLEVLAINHMLSDDSLQLQNPNCLPLIIKLDFADGEFFCEQHLLIQCYTIFLLLYLIHNMVHISDTPAGGFSLSIGQMDVNLHMPVSSHHCCPITLILCSSHHLSKCSGRCASLTCCLTTNVMEQLLLMMLEYFIEKIPYNRGYVMDFTLQWLICPRLVSIGLSGWHLSNSFQAHLTLSLYGVLTLLTPYS